MSSTATQHDGWKEVIFDDVAYPVSETFNFAEVEKVHFLNTSDIFDGALLHDELSDVEGLPGQAKKRFKRNDILFSEIRPQNRRYMLVNFDSKNSVASTKLIVLRAKDGVDSKFLYLWITSKDILDEFQMIAEGRSGSFPQITFDSVKKTPLFLPPLPEQKAIAEVLSSLDDKIDLLHRQNKTLEDMAQALFRKWFIEDAEEEWEEVELDQLVSISSGKGLKKSEYVPYGEYPILGANGEIGRTDKYLFDEKLIFTGRVGTLGNVFMVDSKVWLSDNTLIIRTKDEFFYFVYFLLKNSKLEGYNVGSTQPLIRQSDLKAISVALPSNLTLSDFNKQSKSVFQKIKSNTAQICTLENLRDTLLPKLMSGEVRLNDFI